MKKHIETMMRQFRASVRAEVDRDFDSLSLIGSPDQIVLALLQRIDQLELAGKRVVQLAPLGRSKPFSDALNELERATENR